MIEIPDWILATQRSHPFADVQSLGDCYSVAKKVAGATNKALTLSKPEVQAPKTVPAYLARAARLSAAPQPKKSNLF